MLLRRLPPLLPLATTSLEAVGLEGKLVSSPGTPGMRRHLFFTNFRGVSVYGSRQSKRVRCYFVNLAVCNI